jgi:hypothetical protein
VVATVVGKTDIAPPEVDGEVSTALADGLERTWPAIASRRSGRPPNFRSFDALPRLVSRRMFAGAGAAILWTAESMVTPPPSLSRSRLVKLVVAALGEICPAFVKAEGGTVTVDTNLGIDVPATRSEALSVALRRDVEEVVLGEETLRLTSSERTLLAGDLEVRLSPIVQDVAEANDGVVVTFKRYLDKIRLSGAEARAAQHLKHGARSTLTAFPMVVGVPVEERDPLIRRLENARVVRADVRPA